MAYSKANIITICGTLGTELQNSTTLSRFFDDVIEQLAFIPNPPFINAVQVSISDGTATYNFETDMLRLLHAIMHDTPISIVTEDELNAYTQTWQADEGTPAAATQDHLKRQYTLYPTPNIDSFGCTISGDCPTGTCSSNLCVPNQWDENYPDDPLVIFYAQNRASSFQEYYALFITLLTVAKEFAYSSIHQDYDFAKNCTAMAKFMLDLLEMSDG